MSGAADLAAFLAGQSGSQSGGDPATVVETGSVTAVTPGAAKGGSALVAVSWRGATVTADYLASYTPVQGDVVLVVHHGDLLHIIGRLIGQPI
jgi:hypothetical protein